MIRQRVLHAGILLSLAAVFTARAFADDVTDLGRRLAQLRGEVETLSSSLSREEAEHRDQMRSLARQKAELEAELKREQMRLQRIQQEMGQRRAALAERKSESDKLQPVFDSTVSALREHVRTELPFRSAERLAEIDKVVEQRRAGLLSTERALARLWSFVEDEVRLTRESSLHRQTLSIDGTEQLVDVVRIGMVMLFFKTGDGRVGHVVREGSGWTARTLQDAEDRKRVLHLFDSFKKQIRTGYFEIPNALPERRQP